MMTLREALAVFEREGIGDFVYDIRASVLEDDEEFKGNPWDHPRVKAWSEACMTIERYLKEHPE